MNRKGMETRQHIKTKACQLFAKKGFKEVTMKDICDSTGLSRGDYTAIMTVPPGYSMRF